MNHNRPEDPIEVFQPWNPPLVDAGTPQPMRQRWAPPTPAPDAGKVARSHSQPPPDPTLQPGRFIRAVGIPAVARILNRLKDQGHGGKIKDQLDRGQPSMRVLLWPKPDLLAPTSDRLLAVLEMAVQPEEGNGRVVSHYYIGAEKQTTELAQTPLEGLNRGWILDQVIEFVKLVLERA